MTKILVRQSPSPDPADKFWGIGQYTGPLAGQFKCSVCGRENEDGERVGDTCGARIHPIFEPFTGTTIEEMFDHGDRQMEVRRCMGILGA